MYSWKKLKTEINSTEATGYILAVSGGVDSMMLLDFFRRQSSIPVHVAHFDHHIRDVSDVDALLVSEYCIKHSLPFSIGHGNGLRDITNQECVARIQRWAFLNNEAVMNNCSHVVTAHHLNDQIENVIIRLTRGDPHTCLSMKKFIEIDGIVRYKPFLDIPKDELIGSATRMKVDWNEDTTNTDVSYERNWVRGEVIPMLMERRNIFKSMHRGIRLTNELEGR